MINHVLLRHRLLVQPYGFEGVSPREERLDRYELAVASHREDGELLI
jgi:hypothetical protein